MLSAGFHGLLRRLRGAGCAVPERRYANLAAIAGLAARVKDEAADVLGTVLGSAATPAGQKPVVSALRMRRILACDTVEELCTLLRRALALADDRVNLGDLACIIWHWVPMDEKHRKDPRRQLAILYIERGQLDVLDGAFVVVDKNGVRTHIPVGGVACLMLEPGTRVSHAACALAARVGTLLVWIGEAGVRLYSAGQPGGARADRLLYQARLALDADLPLARQTQSTACRDVFRTTKLLDRIIPGIEEMLAAGGVEPPEAAPEQSLPVIPIEKALGDAGHRG